MFLPSDRCAVHSPCRSWFLKNCYASLSSIWNYSSLLLRVCTVREQVNVIWEANALFVVLCSSDHLILCYCFCLPLFLSFPEITIYFAHRLFDYTILSGQSIKVSQNVKEKLEIPRSQWLEDVENCLRELNLNRWRKNVNNRHKWASVAERGKFLGKPQSN
jgi:hypothetical protein